MVYGSATDPCRCGASAARGGAAKGDRRSLEPEHWKMSDDEILASLLRELATGRLVSALSRLGGRWVIVADTPRETLVFNDAFGMRQVYYTQGTGERWCAAQPG